MRVRRPILVATLPAVLLLGSFAGATPVLAAPCDGSGASLGNGGFETPAVTPDTFTLFPAASVPPWQTTDDLGEIEIWGTTFLGVPAFEGNAFAELNANSPGTLYQDVVSVPGSTMTWSAAHRGRDGDDTMQVLIGDGLLADVGGATGWDYVSPDFTDGNAAWGEHSAEYVVPAGQTCTRFAFRAVSSTGGASYGNFLDAVSFVVTAPPPDPEPEPSDDGGVLPTAAVTPPATDTIASGPVRRDDRPVAFAVALLAAIGGSLTFMTTRRRGTKRG